MDPSAFHGLYIPVSPSSLQGDSEYILSRYVDASQLDGSNSEFYGDGSGGVDVEALDKPFAIEQLELGSLLGTGVAGDQLQHHLTDHTDLVHSYYHPHQLENHAPIDPVNVSYPNPTHHHHQHLHEHHTPRASTSASSSSSSSLVNLHHLNKSHLPPTPTSTISNYDQQQQHLPYQSQNQIPALHQQQHHEVSQQDADPYNLLAAGPAGDSSNSNPGLEYSSRPPLHPPFPDPPQQPVVNTVQDTEPLYVNAKQYHRIVKRRNARARLAEVHRLSNQRKPYLHESRHKHAMRRPRGPGGRFLTKEELAAEKQRTGNSPQNSEGTQESTT